ncbi:50S ribosomal protein L9 [Deinococcus peraridilitoris]|uniref:Large ribosomal subunit protein bL9 n=1 Tax=Deinococcus peraridilitoris (strain DSM 19664 / LMG 22246 / CIP 109416 / KR-200) TaxID=937777 RepID=L0A226_DEIPD|nr:50S ribosomal protein L9 [Deinococcus peraridilitoris]AFZ67499.1 ribosomal protein L9 [Deinococcus peraridilitoris DSM 19664]
MNVILLEPVAKLGKTGEVVSVKPGYARNFLVPRGLALPATASNMKTLEARVKAREKQLAKDKASAQALAEKLQDQAIDLSVRAGEGKIYGAVTASDVAEALAAKGFEVDRRKLEMPKAIKELGEYTVSYKAHPEVSVPLKIVIHAQQ